MPNEARHPAPQAHIQQLYYNTLFYCLTIEQFLIQVLSEVRHTCQRSAILLPLKHLSSNCIISTLFYCLTIEQFLIQVLIKVRHIYLYLHDLALSKCNSIWILHAMIVFDVLV